MGRTGIARPGAGSGVVIEIADTAVAVALGSTRAGGGFVDAILGKLLVQRVAVDAKAGGGLDLDAVASLEHLLDQLALNLADNAVVKIVGAGPRAADALADKLDGQAAEVAAAAMADRPGRGFSAQLGRQVFDEELGTRCFPDAIRLSGTAFPLVASTAD